MLTGEDLSDVGHMLAEGPIPMLLEEVVYGLNVLLGVATDVRFHISAFMRIFGTCGCVQEDQTRSTTFMFGRLVECCYLVRAMSLWKHILQTGTHQGLENIGRSGGTRGHRFESIPA